MFAAINRQFEQQRESLKLPNNYSDKPGWMSKPEPSQLDKIQAVAAGTVKFVQSPRDKRHRANAESRKAKAPSPRRMRQWRLCLLSGVESVRD